MILSVPAVSQTQNLPPPNNPDTGPQTNTDETSGPTMRDRTKAQEDNPVETLKVNVDVVSLLFNVKDKSGHGAQFLQRLLRKEDEAFLISFDVNVDLLQDFTNSEHDIRKGMEAAKINGGGAVGGLPGIGQGPVPISNPKGTLLYDAVFLAAHDKLHSEVGRKALILLTDGEDQGSQLRLQDALEAAQKSDAIVYVLLISDSGVAAGTGPGLMRKLCEETGGRVINVGNNRDKLEKAFDQVSTELRSQYSIGYTPSNGRHDGTFRKVEIKTKEGYKVQTRKGYYAATG
ncbi:MAG: VWA domain-containing protein [Acidobacteria bacterium]|nr:MAG: VWA domain-containing protein [Acidobacteriota bacterium]